MDVSTLILRASSALGRNTVYDSPGKMPSFSASSWPANARNDCSGFVSWSLRFSENRKVDHPLYRKINGGWFETTAIYADGMQSTGYFDKMDSAVRGSLLVYPDYVGSDGRTHDGHIGIVLEASGKGIAGVTRVIHCSAGNYAKFKDAVQITGPDAWLAKKNSIIVWLEGTSL